MSQDDKPYGLPMTEEQRFEQEILMYIRDVILWDIMAPVSKVVGGIPLKSRDYNLIDKATKKYTTGIMKIIKQAAPNVKSNGRKVSR